MAKFRLRNLMARVPFLDKIRIGFLSDGIYYCLTGMDESYDVARIFPDSVAPYIEGEKPCIFALYHGRMVGILRLAPRNKYILLISQSRDGEIVSTGVKKMGFDTIRGSSGRGGVQATKQMLRAAKKGFSLAITVDGPRGPQHEMKPAIIRIAEMSGLPIIPTVCSSLDFTEMWGWDRFHLSHQGSRLANLHGEPFYIPRGIDDEEREKYRIALDKEMTRLRMRSDEYWEVTNQKQTIHC